MDTLKDWATVIAAFVFAFPMLAFAIVKLACEKSEEQKEIEAALAGRRLDVERWGQVMDERDQWRRQSEYQPKGST